MRLLTLLVLLFLALGCVDPESMLTPQDKAAAQGNNPNAGMQQPAPMAPAGP